MSKLSIITKTEFHSLVGKLGHCAGLLITMRPFLEPMWAGLVCEKHSGAPRNCIWRKQVDPPFIWPTAFPSGRASKIERVFTLDAYLRMGTIAEIGIDVSPWGMGGWLTINDHYTHYFAGGISPEDIDMFSTVAGSYEGQQIWECLAVLVAEDLWAHLWNRSRILLQIRGDNVTALTLLVKMRPPAVALLLLLENWLFA